MSGTAAPRPPTLPVWRLLGSELCAPRGCRDDPRLRSILGRAIADPQVLRELAGWPIELSAMPTRHLVQARPPLALVSRRFVAAVRRAGATLEAVEPRLTCGAMAVSGYVVPIIPCRADWLDPVRSVSQNGSVLEDVWRAPPHQAVFLRQPETRIINVTNGVYVQLVAGQLIDPATEAQRCRCQMDVGPDGDGPGEGG